MLTIVAISMTYSSLAQADYKGNITKHDGKKIEGFIKAWEFKTNPSEIFFKETQNSDYQILTVSDIKGFEIEAKQKEVYEGGTFDIELSSRDLNSLSDTSALILERTQGFLQILIDGPKPLYVYRNTVYEQYFIKNDTVLELLVYKKYNKKIKVGFEERTVVMDNNRFKGQLRIYLGDCMTIASAIEKLKYQQSSLINIFSIYYRCVNEQNYHIYIPEKNSILKPGIIIGAFIENLDFNSMYDIEPKIEPINKISTTVGLSIEVPMGIKNSSILLEYMFGRIKANAQGKTKELELLTKTSKYNFDYDQRKINLLYRYRMSNQQYSYFGNVGLSTEKLKGNFEEKITFTYPKTSSWTETYTVTSKLNALRLLIGAGIRYNKISLEGRIEPSFDKTQGFMASVLLNYYFGKEIR